MSVSPRPSGGPVRAAVVGAGYIAAFHLETLAGTQGVELVAVCDADLERARAAARRYGAPHAVTRPAELAALGVQVAHVLVPPELHGRVVRELLEAGVGAYVEKPLVLSSREARELGRLAAERGLPLGAHHNALFHPTFARFAERLRSGALGRLEHLRVCLSVPLRQLDAGDVSHWMFREPANIVFEQAPHPLAQVHALAGRLVELEPHVLVTRTLPSGTPFHQRWVLVGRGERATVELFFDFGAPFTRWTIEALCSDGQLEADLAHGAMAGEEKTFWLDFWNAFLANWRRGGALRRDALRGLWNWSAYTLRLGPRRDAFYVGMRDAARAFHRALAAGETPPASAEDAAQVLEWCEAAVARLAPPPALTRELPDRGPARTGEVVVLGASGFIGRKLVAKLRAQGAPVTAVVRRAHGLPPELDDPGVRLVRASLEDSEALGRAVAGARTVVHLATGGGSDWETIERSMLRGSVALAEACADAGVGRLVFVSSTAALYLGHDAGPAVEDDVPPDPRPQDRPIYARGKILTELALRDLAAKRGLELVIARPAVVLGPGSPLQHSGLGLWVRDNHCVGWGPGDRPVPVVFVDDVADALARAALHEGPELAGKALNLSADTGLDPRRIVAELARATGRRLVFHPRSLAFSQTLEIGKWLVKKVGGRKDAAFPSWRDLKSRQLAPKLPCRTAREVLGWRPTDDPERFLDLAVRSHGAQAPPAPEGPRGDAPRGQAAPSQAAAGA